MYLSLFIFIVCWSFMRGGVRGGEGGERGVIDIMVIIYLRICKLEEKRRNRSVR